MNKGSVRYISFLLFWLLFAPTSIFIPNPTINGWIQNAICLYLVWYTRHDIVLMFNKKARLFNIFLFAFCILSIISIYYNIETIGEYAETLMTQEGEIEINGVTTIKSALYSSIGLIASSLYIQRISDSEKMRVFIKTLYWLLLFIVIPSDIDALLKPAEIGTDAEYLIGNKFHVGYYNLYLCFLYYSLHPHLEYQRYKLVLSSLIGMMLITSIHTQCSTMIVGTLVFLFLVIIAPNSFRLIISSAKSIIITFFIIDLGFFLFAYWLVQYELIQYFIEEILQGDITLSGRIQIFTNIQETFSISPWIGFGFGNARIISYYFTGAFDSQNGLIELFIQIGFLGVATFVGLLYTASKIIENNKIFRYPLVAFILTMIVIGTVEIPFKHVFIFFLSFCFIGNTRFRIGDKHPK